MERMSDKECSMIMEAVYNMPKLKSCPIETTFKIIGKRWTAPIVRELLRGTTQFNRFLENIEAKTPKVLTERLRELQRFGIVRIRIVSDSPISVKYRLMDLGKEFQSVLLVAASFSMRNMPKIVFKDGKPKTPADILMQRQ